MAPSLANPEALEVLSEAVNSTLIDTGRFFRTSGSLPARTQLKASLPEAYDKFQTALDSLLQQVLTAKAILEKDYDALTARKATAPSQPTAPSVPTHEVTMADAPSTAEEKPITLETAQTSEPSASKAQAPSVPAAGDKPAFPAERSGPPLGASASAVAPEPNAATQQEDSTVIDQSPPVTAGEELNFDAMLASMEGSTGSNAPDLNLNVGNDDVGNENFLSGTSFLGPETGSANTQPNNDANSNQNTSVQKNNNHPGSLPHDSEGSAAANHLAGGDFSLELHNLGDANLSQPEQQGPIDLMAPGESSFDDLFMEKEQRDGEDENGLAGLNTMDDSWFT